MGSGGLTELLATGIAQLARLKKTRKQDKMLQLVISSLVLGSAVAAPQDYQGYLSQLHQYRMEYLPESVNSYINKTWEEGRDVAYDLYDEIKEEVISKSDVHVDALTKRWRGSLRGQMRSTTQSRQSLSKREPCLTRRFRKELTRRVCSSRARSSTTWRRSWRGRPLRTRTCPRGSRRCFKA